MVRALVRRDDAQIFSLPSHLYVLLHRGKGLYLSQEQFQRGRAVKLVGFERQASSRSCVLHKYQGIDRSIFDLILTDTKHFIQSTVSIPRQ